MISQFGGSATVLFCVACQVLEAAVVGIPHPKWGERPLLVVVPQPEHAPGETSGGGCGHSSTQGSRVQPDPQATKCLFHSLVVVLQCACSCHEGVYGYRHSAVHVNVCKVSVRARSLKRHGLEFVSVSTACMRCAPQQHSTANKL